MRGSPLPGNSAPRRCDREAEGPQKGLAASLAIVSLQFCRVNRLEISARGGRLGTCRHRSPKRPRLSELAQMFAQLAIVVSQSAIVPPEHDADGASNGRIGYSQISQ